VFPWKEFAAAQCRYIFKIHIFIFLFQGRGLSLFTREQIKNRNGSIMSQDERDFEVRVKGHTLVKVSDESIRIDGKDFHSDLKFLNDLISILSNVVEEAQGAGKPHLVMSVEKKYVPPSCRVQAASKTFPYKVISNA
jgi:hypothetical protein